jgi:hypothetical protein
MSENDTPPEAPNEPKHLSFREVILGPRHEPEQPAKPPGFFAKRKRTIVVSLLAIGAGGAALGAVHSHNCNGNPPDQTTSCGHGGSYGGSWHSWGSFGSSSGSSSSASSSASRGGFGGAGSGHGGGGE